MADKNLDLSKVAEKLISEIKKDPTQITEFTKDPVKFVEKKTGVDLPDDQINQVIASVKKEAGKIDADDIKKGLNVLSSLMGSDKKSK